MEFLSQIDEPMTMVTDYLIAVCGIYFFIHLRRVIKTRGPIKSLRLWSMAFLFISASSLFGGTYHGFTYIFNETVLKLLWKMTTFSIGFVSLFIVLGAIQSTLRPKFQKIIRPVLYLKFLLYIFWMFSHDKFLYVILEYVPAMFFVFIINLKFYFKQKTESSLWMAYGVMISFFAAGIQQSGFDIHQHFNQNDLYHIIQIVGMYCFYKAAQNLEDIDKD